MSDFTFRVQNFSDQRKENIFDALQICYMRLWYGCRLSSVCPSVCPSRMYCIVAKR